MSSLSFIDQFVRCFVPAPFIELARTAQWLRRQGKIDAFECLASLVFGQLSALRLTLNAQAQGLAQPVTRQAIDQRYTPAAVLYLQSAFAHCLNQTLLEPPPPRWLRSCTVILRRFTWSIAPPSIVRPASRNSSPLAAGAGGAPLSKVFCALRGIP